MKETETSQSASPSISIFALTGLFALAYAIVVFAISILPTDMILAHHVQITPLRLWTQSLIRLAAQTLLAWISCLAGLFLGRRTGGRLSGRGFLVTGSILAGALAGVAEVTLRRLLLQQIVAARNVAPIAAEALTASFTVAVVIVVTLLLIVRSTWITPGDQDINGV